MKFVQKLGLKGRFNIVKRDEQGKIIKNYGWQDNLITDYGMNSLKPSLSGGNTSSFNGCKIIIGTGNTDFDFTTTILNNTLFNIYTSPATPENFKWKHNGQLDAQDQITTWTGDIPNNKLTLRLKNRYIFQNPYNITELGLANNYPGNSYRDVAAYYDNNKLFTAVLIRDDKGNKTAISVNKGESLDIVYEIIFQFNYAVKTTALDIDNKGVSQSFEVKHRWDPIGYIISYISPVLNYNPAGSRYLTIYEDTIEDLNTTDLKESAIKNFSRGRDQIIFGVNGLDPDSTYNIKRLEYFNYVDDVFATGHKHTLLPIAWGDDNTHYIKCIHLPVSDSYAFLPTLTIQFKNKTDGKGLPITRFDTLSFSLAYTWSRV